MDRKRVISLILCGVLTTSVCSCTPKEDIFPSIDYPSDESTVSDATEESGQVSNGDITRISCALPYSESTVNRLIKYYYGVNNGLISEYVNGNTVDLDLLDSLDIPWIVESVTVSGDGLSPDLEDQQDLPDIMLVNDILSNEGCLLPLNDIVAMDPGFGDGNIRIDAFDCCTDNGVIYGIPHYVSFPVLVGNLDFVPEEGRIGYLPSEDELDFYIRTIDSEFADEDIIAFTGADSNWQGELRSFSDQLYEEGLASDLDGENADPRFARNAAIWPSSSGNASVWEEYYPGNIYYFRLPVFSDGSDDMADIYCLGLSRNCEHPVLCADIARFISYDPDALLLIQRLEDPRGYYPLVTDISVWNQVRSQGGVNSVFTEDIYE